MEQRSEAYKLYVTDSLFFIQHQLSGGEEEKQMFAMRFADIINEEATIKDDRSPDEIIEGMRNKARSMQ